MKEQISALLDGEGNDLERERALRALGTDPALREAWERYHLASAAIRRELEVMVSPGLADRIHERLQHEAQENTARRSLSPRVLKFTAGLAIAASVATVAILNLPPLVSPSTVSVARNASSPATGKSKSTVAEARQTPRDQQNALNPYLVQHGEFTPAAGMNGLLSYVRVIGRDSAATDNANTE
ncbi:MAG: anti-sigma factor antagonist [Proteobacteria bacterium]|nr:anti-sigma factor antagonist [Pseudomonadota bacterium]